MPVKIEEKLLSIKTMSAASRATSYQNNVSNRTSLTREEHLRIRHPLQYHNLLALTQEHHWHRHQWQQQFHLAFDTPKRNWFSVFFQPPQLAPASYLDNTKFVLRSRTSKDKLAVSQDPVPNARSEARNIFTLDDNCRVLDQVCVSNHFVLDSFFLFLLRGTPS